MKSTIIVLVFLLSFSVSSADTIQINRRLDDVEHKVKQIDSNQLNYQIEKDLLKETYSNNYEKISLVITILLGLVGVFGYLGLKDITAIKKEYKQELNALKQIQAQFNLKNQELESDKKKLDEELKGIIKENEEQSRKIKFIELKDKISTNLKENNLAIALEFANAALNIKEDDNTVLNQKGRILCRLNQMKDATDAFSLALKTDPNDSITIANLAECMYFANDVDGAKKIIEHNKTVFEKSPYKEILELFGIFELYFQNNVDELKSIAKLYVTQENLKIATKKIDRWDLKEAKYFAYYQPDGELKIILQNLVWFWNGEVTGEVLLTRLRIPLPSVTP